MKILNGWLGLRATLAAAALAVVMLGSSVSQAALLNLVPDQPDVTTSFMGVSFDSGTSTFTANGFAVTLDLDGIAPPDHNITGGTYALTAVVDDIGNASGTISIGGTVPALGFNSGTLLTGNIEAWGFVDGGGEIFEFLFAVTGGDLVPLYPVGTQATRGGTVINAVDSNFDGTFGSNFANSGFSGSSDTFPTPEPASIATMLIGLGLLAAGNVWRKRRK